MSTSVQSQPTAEARVGVESQAPAKPRSKAKIILPIVLVVAAAAALGYHEHAKHFEDTDDAQVDGDITNVSPRVSGTIKAVYGVENRYVKAGELLAEIDPVDLEVVVLQARATVAQAEAQLKVEDPTVAITETSNVANVANASSDLSSSFASTSAAGKEVVQLEAQLVTAEANDKLAQDEKARAASLLAGGALSKQDYDQRVTTAAATKAQVDAIKASIAAAQDRVAEASARASAAKSRLTEVKTNAPMQLETRKASVVARQATLDLARAQLKQAELNVSYARIVAPVSGIIGKKGVAVGDRVQPGQQLFAVVQVDDLWVTANFRETQLANIVPGQHATVHVDALDLDLSATVESVGGATGSRLSVLPPENATGNYVKVVQRMPVRIRFAQGQNGLERLRPGMSAEPEVRVR